MPIRPIREAQQRVAEPESAYLRFKRDHPSYLVHVEAMRREFHERCQHLGRLQPRQRHGAIRQLLRMRHLYPAFAFDGLKRCAGFETATPDTVRALAANFDPFRPLGNEPVVLHRISRSPTRSRIVCDFGPQRRMHQLAIASILRQLHPPQENQYLYRGMPRALEAIEAAISAGATHACEVDIVDFYGSVTLDGLAEALRPLPAAVTTHAVWDARMRFGDLFVSASSARPSPTPERPDGLYPGSAASPIVGERLISILLQAARVPGIITYADNLLVLGRSERQVAARLQRLRRVFNDDPPSGCVSGLGLREGEIISLRGASLEGRASMTFANHESIVAFDPDEDVYNIDGWRPSPTKLAQAQVGDFAHETLDQIEQMIRKVSNWRRYYPRWQDGSYYESEYLAVLKARRFTLSPTPEHLASAISALVDAFLLHRADEDRARNLSEFLPGLGGEQETILEREARERIELILSTPRRSRQSSGIRNASI